MANTKTTKSPNVYDTRVIDRNVGDGTLTNDDVKKHIQTLPDVASKAEPFDTSLRGTDRDEDEDDDQDEG
jgi:hypothetical protein